MKYIDFIKGNEGFQYSINVQYDLMNMIKIGEYIPTKSSVEVIYEYLLNFRGGNRPKATVLIGPYGKGKSHLLLVLLGLMCGNSQEEELRDLVSKIRNIDSLCGELAEDSLKSKKYFPVIINFNSGDLNQAFLVALKQALDKERIKDILPYTYFDSAIKVINGWKSYKSTIDKFSDLIHKGCGLNLNQYKNRLKAFDEDAYKLFKEVFLEITSGIEFNPLLNTDVVKLVDEINHSLKEHYNYDGMIIVFDEFSKFIESSTKDNVSRNLKILQDIAELSDRTTNPYIHLICITHKTINEYISKIPQDKVEAWRAIEGRFKSVFFNSTSQQNYELISNAIIKEKESLNNFIEIHKEVLYEAINEGHTLFSDTYDSYEYWNEIVKGCFPLSPYTTYALPILSEKVAQNERTLFTYLSKTENNSLMDKITKNNGELSLVTIENLYEYFEPLLKKETFNKYIHDIWVKADTSIKIVYSEYEKNIIKGLAIIYIINDFKHLPPKEYVIKRALNMDEEIFNDSINKLKTLGILVFRKGNETLDFMPISSVDINSRISSLVETKFKTANVSDVFYEIAKMKYLLPKRYNDKYKLTRYFKREFIITNEILSYSSSNQLLTYYKSDGLVIDLIYFSYYEIDKVMQWYKAINDSRIILVIPNEALSVKEDVSEYKAIQYLKNDIEFLKEDRAIESQMNILYEDIIEKLEEYITRSYDIESNNCKIYMNNFTMNSLRMPEVSMILSDICEEHFKCTPIINNELINKNQVSTPIYRARNIIVTMLLDGSYEDFDSSKNSLECTLFRATIENKYLLNKELLETSDINIIIKEIKGFLVKAEKKDITFKDLYDKLTTNNKMIGIRKGTLPIYLAFVLKDYEEDIVLYLRSGRTKKEVDLGCNILNNINDTPESYFVKIEKGTEERKKYIDSISDIFRVYLGEVNGINNRYSEIVRAMQRWIQSLSLFAKNHTVDIVKNDRISDKIINLRKELIKYDLNYRSFLLKELLKILKVNTYEECIYELGEIKNYLDDYDVYIKHYLIKKSNEIINSDYEGTLTSNIRSWYMGVEEERKVHLFNGFINEFIRFINELKNNDIEAVEKLSLIFTGLAIEDWNNDSINIYLLALDRCKHEIESHEVICDLDSNQGLVKILIEGDNSELIEKTFNKVKISDSGSILLNSIEGAIEEFADSVDDNEKRNILIEILGKYI